jgi:hypothetical protein
LGTGVRIHLLGRAIVDLNYLIISTEKNCHFSIASPVTLFFGYIDRNFDVRVIGVTFGLRI